MQFLLKEKPDKEGLVRLRGEDYHYLVHVRRLKPGAVFPALLTPPGAEARRVKVTVTGIDKNILTGSVTYTDQEPANAKTPADSKIPDDTELPPIILFQALPKGAKMDLIVRQATETGISEIVPFISEYSVPKAEERGGREGERSSRTERWTRIVKEARQQSLSATDTRVHDILSADKLFDYWEKLQSNCSGAVNGGEKTASCGFIFTPQAAMDCGDKNASGRVFAEQKLRLSESAGTPILNSLLAKGGFHRYLNIKPSLLVLAVGPEGGFSAMELERFIKAGFKAVSLGATVLRTETAALYGAAAAKIIMMEKAWWETKLP